jgi:hypothetical protein
MDNNMRVPTRTGTLYWVMLWFMGILIYFNEHIFQNKFHFKDSENLYFGGAMIAISSIVLIWKATSYLKKKK